MSDPPRLITAQQREVSKVLLDGLYDPHSPLSMPLGVRMEVVGEIIWMEMLVWNWQIYPPFNPQKASLASRSVGHRRANMTVDYCKQI